MSEVPLKSCTAFPLSLVDHDFEHMKMLNQVVSLIHNAKDIIFIVGAGISVAGGVQCFRGPDGVFTTEGKAAKNAFHHFFQAATPQDEENSRKVLYDLTRQAETGNPTAFHDMIADIASRGRLRRLYTQNIDNLDTRLAHLSTVVPLQKQNGAYPLVIQLHGSLFHTFCSKCASVEPSSSACIETELRPVCKTGCLRDAEVRSTHGMRPTPPGRRSIRVTLYDGPVYDAEEIAAVMEEDAEAGDLIVVAGTSLALPHLKAQVHRWCNSVRNRGGHAILIDPNRQLNLPVDWHCQGDAQTVARRSLFGWPYA